MDTKKANESVKNFSQIVKAYRDALDLLKNELTENHGIKDADHIKSVNWVLQFAVDFNSGTSFMDFVNVLALSNVKDQLNQLKIKINATHSQIQQAHKKLAAKLTAIICEARQLCSIEIP